MQGVSVMIKQWPCQVATTKITKLKSLNRECRYSLSHSHDFTLAVGDMIGNKASLSGMLDIMMEMWELVKNTLNHSQDIWD